MKKFLLSAAVALLGLSAQANTTLSFLSFTAESDPDVKGTWCINDGATYGRWQPVESITRDGYTLTFVKGTGSTEPAVYGSNAGEYSVRVYKANSMTITAPEGVTMYGMNFTSASSNFSSCAATAGTVDASNISAVKWTCTEGTNTVTFTPDKTFRFTAIEVLTEPGQGGGTTDPGTNPGGNENPGGGDENPGVNADDLTWVSFNDATDIVGDLTPEKSVEENPPYGSAANYANLQSFKLGDYSYTFTPAESGTKVALYMKMSTSEDGNNSVRLYKNNAMTITAPEGTTLTSIVFDISVNTNNFTWENATITPSTGTFTFLNDTYAIWKGDATNTLTLSSVNAQVRFYKVAYNQTVSSENPGGNTPSTTTITLSANNAEEIDGEFAAEEAPSEANNNNGQAAHYQPLKSFYIGDYNFSFAADEAATAPALYLPMSTSPTGNNNVRLYSKNGANTTMTIYAPEGVKMTKLVFDCSNVTSGISFTANAGSASYDGKKYVTWEYAEGREELELTSTANWRWYSVEVTTLGGSGVEEVSEQPVVLVLGNSILAPEGAQIFNLNGQRCAAEGLQSGVYVVVCGQKAVKVLVK